MAKLKIWNGNAQTFVPIEEAAKRGLRHNSYVHVYGCAPSRAALCRMVEEWSGRSRSLNGYIRDYWSEGAWGDWMEGIEPEIGLWVSYEHGKPERVWPRSK
jgi:hypothetical protein